MAENNATTEPLVDVIVTQTTPPATDADDQKSEKPAAADATTAESAVETTEQQEAKKQSKFQRRLDRQKSARVAAETELRLTREERDSLKAKLEGKDAAKPEGEPQRDQFQDYETYLRAVAKYDAAQETDKRVKADREERQRGEQQKQANAGSEKIAQDWVEREKKFQAETKDYEAVVTPFVEEELGSFTDAARRAIVESEVGPQLLHHLATNPEVAERISELSPLRQVAELGKLEATVAAAPAPKPKPASNAPAPIKPLAQGRSAATGLAESDSQAEYEAKRKTQGARWAH